MKEKQPSQILFITAGTIIILSSFAQFLKLKYAPYVFVIGAALLIFIHGINAFDKTITDQRQQRLARIGFFTSFTLALAAYFMFTDSNTWVVMVLIYALSSFFQSFRGNANWIVHPESIKHPVNQQTWYIRKAQLISCAFLIPV